MEVKFTITIRWDCPIGKEEYKHHLENYGLQHACWMIEGGNSHGKTPYFSL